MPAIRAATVAAAHPAITKVRAHPIHEDATMDDMTLPPSTTIMNATIVTCTEMVNLRLLPKFLHRNGVMLQYAPIRLNFPLFVSCISLFG